MPPKRRPKLTQVIPSGPTPMFQVVEYEPGDNYWHVKITDLADVNDRPEFTCPIPRTSKYPPWTPHEIAVAGAGECSEGRGLITCTEYLDGIPIHVSVHVGNSMQIFCIRSTDPDRAKPVDPMAGRRWLAARQREALRAPVVQVVGEPEAVAAPVEAQDLVSWLLESLPA